MLEIGSPVLLFVPTLASFGASTLAMVMVGTILAHLVVLGGSAVALMVLLAATLTIAWPAFACASEPSELRRGSPKR